MPWPLITADARTGRLAKITRKLRELGNNRAQIEKGRDALRQARAAVTGRLDTIDAEADRLHAERRQLYRGRVTVVDPALSAKLAELTASTSDKSQSIVRMNSALRALLT